MRNLLISLAALLPSFALAEVKVTAPIQVEKQFSQRNADFSRTVSSLPHGNMDPNSTGYTECFGTAEIKGGFLCVSGTQYDMNIALARASIFVEGLFGAQKGEVVSTKAPGYLRNLRRIGGHDLRSQDLLEYYSTMEKSCASNADFCPLAGEKEFFETFVIPMTRQAGDIVVITYAIESSMAPGDVVTHEILHAQYFLQPKFREVCDSFWKNQLSEAERVGIRNDLGEAYNAGDEFLMMNEFQAYMLMANAERHMLGRFVSTYRNKLLSQLEAVGLRPVQVTE